MTREISRDILRRLGILWIPTDYETLFFIPQGLLRNE